MNKKTIIIIVAVISLPLFFGTIIGVATNNPTIFTFGWKLWLSLLISFFVAIHFGWLDKIIINDRKVFKIPTVEELEEIKPVATYMVEAENYNTGVYLLGEDPNQPVDIKKISIYLFDGIYWEVVQSWSLMINMETTEKWSRVRVYKPHHIFGPKIKELMPTSNCWQIRSQQRLQEKARKFACKQ